MADRLLPSWNEGPARSAILDFVARVTMEGGSDYVPPSERIATFDNDGTLWCEQPFQTQIFFLIDRIRELAVHDPGEVEQIIDKERFQLDVALQNFQIGLKLVA